MKHKATQHGFTYKIVNRPAMCRDIRRHDTLSRLWVGSPVGCYHRAIAIDLRVEAGMTACQAAQ